MKYTLLFLLTQTALANPFFFEGNNGYLKLEVLKNEGLYFETSDKPFPQKGTSNKGPLIKPQKLELGRAQKYNQKVESLHHIISVNENLCVEIFSKRFRKTIVQTCSIDLDQDWKTLQMSGSGLQNIYGLGQYFVNPGTADGDLQGRIWDPGYDLPGNNALRWFSKGANSAAIFPIIFAQGKGYENFFLLYNNYQKQYWDIKNQPYSVGSYGKQSWFIYTASDVKELRRKYMQLTGKAPLPKKSTFGFWLSEFGYDSWNEVDYHIKRMDKFNIPFSGMSLDLQWFGGEFFSGNVDRSGSQFGRLRFDEKNFPNPRQKIAKLKQRGIELMPIEESYISKWLPEHQDLVTRNYMANICGTNTPVELTANPWWGIGGMIDWTNDKAGAYWHDQKRQYLIEMGLTHHWTDLGEPEMFDANACYHGIGDNKTQKEVHNIYNFKWLESIYKGYQRNQVRERGFTMSRSGTVGIQRFGAGMWSGDIGANMGALTAHYNAQMHMTYSGVDYYGADIGGFHRSAGTLDGDENELFTQWLANAVYFDFPVRTHTWNILGNNSTNPTEVGDLASNRYNIKLRYYFMPYYYSLGYQLYQKGDAIIRPMSMEFPTDKNVREMGNQKMVGPFMMANMVARYGETSRNIYLPKGVWYDFYSGKSFDSAGLYFKNFPTYQNGKFTLPLLLKAGAIIPTQNVTDSFNFTNNNEMTFIITDRKSSQFTLYEDDENTTDYQREVHAKTKLILTSKSKSLSFDIKATQGDFSSFKDNRIIKVVLYSDRTPKSISLNGQALSFEKVGVNKYQVFLGMQSMRSDKELIFSF